MRNKVGTLMGATALSILSTSAFAETLTIATVNNGDMIRMQGLTEDFTAKTGHDVDWVVLEENTLRTRVTQDIAANGGQFDIMTIGMYEAPIWGALDWLVPLDDLSAEYDIDDILPAMRNGLSVDGIMYAAPFYGESSMVFYRTDLMEAAGLEMPHSPTWEFIREAAIAMTDKENEIYGACLRGKAGWGDNMAFITSMANSFGARWFDEDWKPQFDSPEWKETLTFYLDLLDQAGPPGSSGNSFNESLTLFNQGKCGMWIDATVAASKLTDPNDSVVADKVGFALAPHKDGVAKNGNWLWAWALAIPTSTQKEAAAKEFIEWATSKDYIEMVAASDGWANVPPGTRTSLYENPEYQKVPFAAVTLESIQSADPNNPTVEPVPYIGVQFAAIPEFAGIAGQVAQEFSAAVAGQQTAEEALEKAQDITAEAMEAAGY